MICVLFFILGNVVGCILGKVGVREMMGNFYFRDLRLGVIFFNRLMVYINFIGERILYKYRMIIE